MKNTRNKVRMTESQLHQVIKESVKQVLSEMEWGTMHDAYMGAYAAGRPEQGERIGKLYRDMYDPDQKWSPFRLINPDAYGSDYYEDGTIRPRDNDLSYEKDEIRGCGNRYTGKGHPANHLNKNGQKRLDWKSGKIPSSEMRCDILNR